MSDMDNPPRQPLWVKVFTVVMAIVVVGIAAMMLVGGHGPWQHDPGVHRIMPNGNAPQ